MPRTSEVVGAVGREGVSYPAGAATDPLDPLAISFLLLMLSLVLLVGGV